MGLHVLFLHAMRRVRLPALWSHRRAGALGRRQAPPHNHLHVVPLDVGEVFQLAGGRARVPHQRDHVFRSVAMAMAWGRDHVDLTGNPAIGIDEIHWPHGSNFLTLVYQIDPTRKRLLWISQH